MPDATLVTILTGAGVAGVFCVLFILGLVVPRAVVTDLKEENRELKDALESERDRGNTAVASQSAVADVLAAIQAGLALGARQREERAVRYEEREIRRERGDPEAGSL